ncbi:MAG: SIR2 family protein, partial [Candidatus Bathyarchaeota archaeon]
DWLRTQDWWNDEEEYSILFEKVYDQRSQRRIYIEECVKDAKPSWGYIYLANIIAHTYFNAVFTPNFDDLLNEACFLYAECRPIVCAHDSAVIDIRVTSARPKIIKLHGDFLYDSIKNTVRELETLENNMRDKFMQFAREYGLVVIGYGGNDRSIMDVLDRLLMSQGYFPNGLYWCTRSGDTVSKKVERLLRRERAYWVEIVGFDEFMAELHKGLGLTLPDTVRDPYKATTARLNRFILPIETVRNPIMKSDVSELEKHVKRFEQVISGKERVKKSEKLLPHTFLGAREYRRGNYQKALEYYEKGLHQDPGDRTAIEGIFNSYLFSENFDKAIETSEKLIKMYPKEARGYHLKSVPLIYLNRVKDTIQVLNEAVKLADHHVEEANILISLSNAHLVSGNWQEALSATEKSLQKNVFYGAKINKSLALKKLGKEDEAFKIIQDTLPEILNKYGRACAYAVLGDKSKMLRELKAAISENLENRVSAKFDPDFADYREDPDFRKLVHKDKAKSGDATE